MNLQYCPVPTITHATRPSLDCAKLYLFVLHFLSRKQCSLKKMKKNDFSWTPMSTFMRSPKRVIFLKIDTNFKINCAF